MRTGFQQPLNHRLANSSSVPGGKSHSGCGHVLPVVTLRSNSSVPQELEQDLFSWYRIIFMIQQLVTFFHNQSCSLLFTQFIPDHLGPLDLPYLHFGDVWEVCLSCLRKPLLQFCLTSFNCSTKYQITISQACFTSCWDPKLSSFIFPQHLSPRCQNQSFVRTQLMLLCIYIFFSGSSDG